MTLPDLDTSTRIALRRFAEEEGISLEEAVVRLVRDRLVGLGMVEEEGDEAPQPAGSRSLEVGR